MTATGKRYLALALGLLCGAGRVRASGLNISPVQVRLSPEASKSLLTLRNEGPEDVRYQVSIMTWDEDARTGMKLGPTEDIIVFPTILELKIGETRSLRVGSMVPFGPIEKTYRVFLEELPAPEKPQARSTVRVLTRVGIPIFLAPVQTLEDHKLSALALLGSAAAVDVQNTGNVHLRVDSVRLEGFAQGGEKLFEKQAQGWYVLAGGHRRYELEVPKDACAKVRRLVVSVKTDKEQVLQEPLETPGGACRT
ncbi:MAG TPA: fimbria/pilus periplasmic chaperone [Myxococcales bacterium]|nr:fimbria/pilus periplasmic chaperone [Myxococcales bacterium]